MFDKFKYFSLFGLWPIVILFLVVPSIAGAADPIFADANAQTEALQTQALRNRLESMRTWTLGVTLSFTGLNQAFAVGMTPMRLRLGGCTYDVAKDMPGLIDILLGAQIRVGSPVGWESHTPEARFGVYVDEDWPAGLDLWFSNPMHFPSQTDSWVVGQSHDRGEVTAYKIMAAPTLRNALWDWARAHGYPRQSNAATCREIEKYDPPRQVHRQ